MAGAFQTIAQGTTFGLSESISIRTRTMRHHLVLVLLQALLISHCYGQTSIRMERAGDLYLVPCKLNGLQLKFIFDTGASDVSISLSEALFMLKNGYLNDSDFKGTQQYKIANGEIQEGTILNIRSLELGGITLNNVSASVVHSMSAPLLLGQSAISRFGSFRVDYATNTLMLGTDGSWAGMSSATEADSTSSVPDQGRIRIGHTLLSDYESQLLREAYVRMLWEIRASHILVELPENPSSADTLAAWRRIDALRARVLAGEDWASVAEGPRGSDDPSVAKNAGDLGWFTVLQMDYPFETMAFNTPVGQISPPVRSRFGYHIVKVTDRRTARGQVKVAHIMVHIEADESPEKQALAWTRISEVSKRLSRGEISFSDAVWQYSDDEASNTKGGELPLFGTGKLIRAFEDAAFSLYQVGDVSLPFRTPYGWHIVKLLERIPIAGFITAKGDLWLKIMADKRYQP